MAEYIKRGDALKIMKGAWSQLPGDDAMQEAIDSITHLTAADVAERKKGKWKTAYLDHEAFGVRPHTFYCSECHQITSFRTFFCPNCGADMREPAKEET